MSDILENSRFLNVRRILFALGKLVGENWFISRAFGFGRPISGMLVMFIKFDYISNRLLLIALDERYYTVGPLLVPVLSGLLVYLNGKKEAKNRNGLIQAGTNVENFNEEL